MNSNKVNLEEAIQKNLNTQNWITLKFSDLVSNVVEKVVPKESNLVSYIGLEHLDSGSLNIKRFGNTSSLKGDKLKIYSGDFILAKRNAYLKRVAISKIDAIASAHSLVLRSRPDYVEPKFLPFFLLSEKFWERAIEISVGSLSPTINWNVLAKQEFIFPHKTQQIEFSKLLWAIDDLISENENVYIHLDQLFKVNAKLISNDYSYPDKYKKIKEIVSIKDNLRIPLNSSQRNKMQGVIPYYGANGLVDHVNKYIFDEDLVLLAEDGGNYREFFKEEIAYKVSGKSWVNNHAHVLSLENSSLELDWIYYSLVHKNILKFISGSTRLKLNKSELENIRIWVPDQKKRDIILKKMRIIEDARKLAYEKLLSSKELLASTINSIFEKCPLMK